MIYIPDWILSHMVSEEGQVKKKILRILQFLRNLFFFPPRMPYSQPSEPITSKSVFGKWQYKNISWPSLYNPCQYLWTSVHVGWWISLIEYWDVTLCVNYLFMKAKVS